ncbi:MAG: hypothetical protein QOD61_1599 [Solirubrobacteraceae bacterium]|nr:hypothetical protein [Solirubrobacteraceae bacterium]
MSRLASIAPLLHRGAGRVPGLSPALGLLERPRREAMLQHRVGRRRPPIPVEIVPDLEPQARDVEIAARLLAAHRAAAADGPPLPDPARADLWRGIYRRQRRFAEILARGDPPELAGYLCNVSRHDASQGITQGNVEYARITRDRSYRDFLALLTKDSLVALAEALGAVPVENPAQGSLGASLHADSDALLAGVERRVGIELRPPEIDGGLLKLSTARGRFGERDLNAIFTAWVVHRTIPPGGRICEIGAGSGRVAYWSHRLGARSITLIDLPHVNVVQGYYLLRSLPDAPITLYGEPAPSGESLRILPNHAIAADHPHPHPHAYDLVLNQDSFPEMHPDTVADYLRWIRSVGPARLLSINHENKPPYGRGLAHVSVPEAVARAGGFELEDRVPYWLRRGYVTELYRVLGEGPTPPSPLS